LQDVTNHLREGPGIAHALVYDGEMSKSAAGAVEELHQDLRAIREGNGMAHALLYGDDSSQHVMSNLNAMSDDLKAIVTGVRQGKGTLGALLVDPTVYEDLKSVIGNVERNQVLRALVRYSIKADERNAPPPRVEPRP
jgi:phospholipid/cholesterol/gamma-HCH transport system substrate-binding protein